MSDIFISYSSEDRMRVLPIVHALEETGWSVFWDTTIPAGKTWRQVIHSEIEVCRVVIVCWTARSITSEWVLEEAEIGKSRGILIPILLDNIRPQFGFGNIQAANLAVWNEDSSSTTFTRLVADIAAILGPPPVAVKDSVKRHRLEVAARRKAEEESLRKQKRQWSNESAQEKPDEDNLREIDNERTRARQEATYGDRTTQRQEGNLEPGTVFHDTLKDGSQGPEMVVIPAGMFRMGDFQGGAEKSERPGHTVRFRKPFAMGKYEVTFEEYDRFAKVMGCKLPYDKNWGRGQRPVIYVSWQSAVDYARWLSELTGKRYRLPTEAEWEYAAKGGTETAYWWGEDLLKNIANCQGFSSGWDEKTAPVGSFKANPLGLYDTAGNVWEWVEDCWHEDYNGAPADGSAWKEEKDGNCGARVIRGGSLFSFPKYLRSSSRNWFSTGIQYFDIGFRVARDLD